MFSISLARLDEKGEGLESLSVVLEQLEGFPIAAAAWEKDILPARINLYSGDMLENLSLTGRISWLRLLVPYKASSLKEGDSESNKKLVKHKRAPISQSPIAIVQRSNLDMWRSLFPAHNPEKIPLSAYAKKVITTLSQQGAMFFIELVQQSGILRTQAEDALGELVNWGLVTADSFAGLRALVTPAAKRPRYAGRRGVQVVVSHPSIMQVVGV